MIGLYCLLCCKPQQNLSVHLSRTCMKDQSKHLRIQELQRAKRSMQVFAHSARIWQYDQMSDLIPDVGSRMRMIEELKRRNCFVLGCPISAEGAGPSQPVDERVQAPAKRLVVSFTICFLVSPLIHLLHSY